MSRPDGAPLKRVESYQWPSGHVAHLTKSQLSALDKFKELIKAKGYFEPGDEKTSASHDDETLLRYLRARKWVPQDAFGQFKDTEDWRQENEIDNLYETIDIEEYETTRRLYPQWTGRRDKRGIPLYVFEVAGLKAKEVSAYQNDEDRKKDAKLKQSGKSKVPRKMMRLFALYENLCRFVLPLCSAISDRPSSETPVSQSSNIVDISKVGLKQFWNLRAHLQDSSALATAHYPETLDRIFIIGAPSFFPTVWDWAKGWFDPITVQKIKILGKQNTFSVLNEFIDIDNIPTKYGGKLEWSFGDMPFLEPKVAEALRWKEDIHEHGHRTLPIGPVKWQYDGDGDLVAVAIGTENGSLRHKVLAGLHPEAGVARLALSPGRPSHKHQALFATASRTGAETLHQTTSNSNRLAAQKASGNDPATVRANGTPAPLTAMDTVSKATTQDPEHDAGKSLDAHSPATSRAGTYTVPYRDPANDISHPPEDANREGTSSTRFEQQEQTHAAGQLADGTPAVREDGQGTQHSVMEPRTVGQAHKETPLTKEVDAAPTMVEQAQGYVASAQAAVTTGVASFASAVGLGGEKKEAVEEVKEKKEDPRVDAMEQAQVEEMLRAKTLSQGEQTKETS